MAWRTSLILTVASALLGCDAIVDFFVGSWAPDDPGGVPYIEIVETGRGPTDSGLASIVQAEVVAGGIAGERFIALYARGASVSPFGRRMACVALEERASLPISVTLGTESVEIWAALVTREAVGATTDADAGGPSQPEAGGTPDPDSAVPLDATTEVAMADAAPPPPGDTKVADEERCFEGTSSNIGLSSECISAALSQLCNGSTRVHDVAHALFTTFPPIVPPSGEDAEADTMTLDASDRTDARDSAPEDEGGADAANTGRDQ